MEYQKIIPLLDISTTAKTKPFIRGGQANLTWVGLFGLNLTITALVLTESAWYLTLAVLNPCLIWAYTHFVVRLQVYPAAVRITTSMSVQVFSTEAMSNVHIHCRHTIAIILWFRLRNGKIPGVFILYPHNIREVAPMYLCSLLAEVLRKLLPVKTSGL